MPLTVTGAPNPPARVCPGGYLVRPRSCELKWFNGAIGRVEVTGNVVSRKTGQVGNRLASETFMIVPAAEGEEVPASNRFDGPDCVIEIYEAANALGETPSREA